MNDNTGRIAIAALLVAIGAKDHEMEPTVKILYRSPVPKDYAKMVQAARDALALVRAALCAPGRPPLGQGPPSPRST